MQIFLPARTNATVIFKTINGKNYNKKNMNKNQNMYEANKKNIYSTVR